jgi:hypothetical protein
MSELRKTIKDVKCFLKANEEISSVLETHKPLSVSETNAVVERYIDSIKAEEAKGTLSIEDIKVLPGEVSVDIKVKMTKPLDHIQLHTQVVR